MSEGDIFEAVVNGGYASLDTDGCQLIVEMPDGSRWAIIEVVSLDEGYDDDDEEGA